MFRVEECFHLQGKLRNVGKYFPIETAYNPIRLESSSSPKWERQTSKRRKRSLSQTTQTSGKYCMSRRTVSCWSYTGMLKVRPFLLLREMHMCVAVNLQYTFVSYRAGCAQMSAAPRTPNWDSTGDKRCAIRLPHLFEIKNAPDHEVPLCCRNFWVDTSDFPSDSSFASMILGNKE